MHKTAMIVTLIGALAFTGACKDERKNRRDKDESSKAQRDENTSGTPSTKSAEFPPLPAKPYPEKKPSTEGIISLGKTIEKDGMQIQPLWVEKSFVENGYPPTKEECHRLVLQFKNVSKERKRECSFSVTLLDSAGHQFNENFAYSNDGWSGFEIFPGVTGVDSEYVKTHGKSVGDLTFVVAVSKCAEFEMRVPVSTSEIREVSTFELLPEFLESEKPQPKTVSPSSP